MKKNRGFTLIELLVVIAIIAVLVALILPAVQQAREAARRMQCKNNMKQIGLALANYESNYACLPMEKIGFSTAAGYYVNYSQNWIQMMLPFIDQAPLYSSFNFNLNWDDTITPNGNGQTNAQLAQTQLPGFMCPSAPDVFSRQNPAAIGVVTSNGITFPNGFSALGGCDYMASSGVRYSIYVQGNFPSPGAGSLSAVLNPPQPNAAGVLPSTKGDNRFASGMHSTMSTKLQQISDGMSNTMLLVECAGRPSLYRGSQHSQIMQSAVGYKPSDGWGWADIGNSGALDGATADGTQINSAVKQPIGQLPTCPIPTACPVGANVFINATNDSEIYAFHTGGANVLMADGSVRFLSENMSLQTLAAICTRDGGEVVGEF